MKKGIGMNLIVLFMTSILVTSCSGIKQTSEPKKEETTKATERTTQSTSVPIIEPTQMLSDFDKSLSDENIQGYYGLMWETAVESQQ